MKKILLVFAFISFLSSPGTSQPLIETFTVVYHERVFCRYTPEDETQTVEVYLRGEKKKRVTTLLYINHCDTLRVFKEVSRHRSLPHKFLDFSPCEYPPKWTRKRKPTQEEIDDFPKVISFLERKINPKVVKI